MSGGELCLCYHPIQGRITSSREVGRTVEKSGNNLCYIFKFNLVLLTCVLLFVRGAHLYMTFSWNSENRSTMQRPEASQGPCPCIHSVLQL